MNSQNHCHETATWCLFRAKVHISTVVSRCTISAENEFDLEIKSADTIESVEHQFSTKDIMLSFNGLLASGRKQTNVSEKSFYLWPPTVSVPFSWRRDEAVVINASTRSNVKIEPNVSFQSNAAQPSLPGTKARNTIRAQSAASWKNRQRPSAQTYFAREIWANW